MATSSKIRIMISSRCNTVFPPAGGRVLSEFRKELKKEIEAITLFDKPLFEVWINEEEPPWGGNWGIWDVCMQAVHDCDILLALYTGDAGWSENAGEIGICHAELKEAMSYASAKVRAIDLTAAYDSLPGDPVNQRFQAYCKSQKLFTGAPVKTEKELRDRVMAALFKAVVHLTQTGVLYAMKGRFHTGSALDWSRMNFKERASEMSKSTIDAIRLRPGNKLENDLLFARLGNKDVLIICHSIPASLTIGAAREMVGQPFLNDYQYADKLVKDCIGPVHIIACHKNATESQAVKMLGFPDAIVVTPPFGIYVADLIQKVQFVFLANCRDDSTTREAVKRLFEWLEQTDEVDQLVERAAARARIVKAVAREVKATPPS